MYRLITTLGFALFAPQLSALSCIAPDIAMTHEILDASLETFAVLQGQITYDATGFSEAELLEGVTVQGYFEGVLIGRDWNFTPLSTDITVSFGCSRAWGCFGVNTDADLISFVEVSETGYHISSGPCGSAQFSANDPSIMETLQRCMNGERCDP